MKKNKAFQKKYTGGRQEVATCRHDVSKDVESACSRDGSHRKVQIEETDGCCCGQKEQRLLKLRRSFPPWPLSIGEKECGLEHGGTNKKEAQMRQIREVQMWWKQVRGLALAVMCETRDMGMKWPCWHTWVFNE